MRYSTLFIPTLLRLSLAAVGSRVTPADTPFTVIAAHSASPIHLLSMNAVNGSFFIGGKGPTTFCPEPLVENCPSGTSTTLSVSADGGCGLGKFGTISILSYVYLSPLADVLVPGGQQVFVRRSGALGFTSPHSHIFPKGAAVTNFTETPGSSSGSLGSFSFSGLGSAGFIACPLVNGTGPYRVYAQLTDFKAPNSNACISFDALTSPASGPGAYEYK